MRWITWSAVVATGFLTACATPTAPPDVRETVDLTAPDLETYGEAFENRMADELDLLPVAECPRTGTMPADCSALLTWVLDQQRLRDQVRVLEQ